MSQKASLVVVAVICDAFLVIVAVIYDAFLAVIKYMYEVGHKDYYLWPFHVANRL